MSTDAKLPQLRYAIDAADKICYVDDAWDVCAEANDGTELAGSAMLGRSLWDCIDDATTCALYQQVVARVRLGGSAQFSLRCDGPSCRRLLEMTVTAGADGLVQFETRTVYAEDRPPVVLLARDTTRSTDLLRACAWCNRVNVGSQADDWVEVEDAVARLRLFEHGPVPLLTHGICESCLATMMKTIEAIEMVE